MAAIRETLTLADQFSATLNRYLSLLQRSASAGQAAASSQKGMETAAKGAGGALEQMARSAEGTAFILESSSFDILTALCDRILLINNNQVMGVLNGPHITQQSILSAMLSDSTPGGDFLV